MATEFISCSSKARSTSTFCPVIRPLTHKMTISSPIVSRSILQVIVGSRSNPLDRHWTASVQFDGVEMAAHLLDATSCESDDAIVVVLFPVSLRFLADSLRANLVPPGNLLKTKGQNDREPIVNW